MLQKTWRELERPLQLVFSYYQMVVVTWSSKSGDLMNLLSWKSVSRYKDEEPMVVQRIREFKILHEDLVKNQTANNYKDLIQSAQQGHPTSIFGLIRNWMANWKDMLTNTTLYGKRLEEFLKSDQDFAFPEAMDMQMAGSAMTIIMETYNISLDELIKGNVFGHQGHPLNSADCYEIVGVAHYPSETKLLANLLHSAKASVDSHLIAAAKKWLDAALKDIDLSNLKKDSAIFNVTDALILLSKIVFQKGKSEKAIDLLEKATDLDPENQALHQLYLQYRFGRDVKRLPTLDPRKMENWRSKFFQLCANATLSPLQLNTSLNFNRRKCRYRHSATVPYRRYQEEILSFAPHISVLYNFVSQRDIAAIRNQSALKKFSETLLPGNDRSTLWQYKAAIFPDDVQIIGNISHRIGDVTGLSVSQTDTVSLGESIHIIDYGIGGTCLPHHDNLKRYKVDYMGLYGQNRLATVQIYMSDPKVGGEVIFSDPIVIVKPRQGMALLYYNYKPDGTKDTRAYVGTCPLAVGENLVLEKGIWSTGNDDNVRCGKSPRATFLGLEKTKSWRPKAEEPEAPDNLNDDVKEEKPSKDEST